jgi:crotonobetainyl-CoA:carnitine CoA-transferase CaiB-like acyl-CoA transferase
LTDLLAGIRVLDLTTNIAGPSATMILADMGADVIHVEHPEEGSPMRSMGPHKGEWGAYFVAVNRGKRSLALDVSQPEGRDLIRRLLEGCDVLVENFVGWKATELGLDENAVRAVRPDILYVSLSAYGSRGPDHEKPGYDALLQARTGILSAGGGTDHPSLQVPLLDMGSGVWTALGILAGLFERQRSGQGERIESSLFQTGVTWMTYPLLCRQFTGQDPVPQGTCHPEFAPFGDFPTADGLLLIGVSTDRLFARLCMALEHLDWTKDSRFATNSDRLKNREELREEMASVLKESSTEEWLKRFEEYGVPVSPVQGVGDLLDDAQLAAMEQLQDIDLPHAKKPTVRLPRLPIEFSAGPSSISGPPPQLGEHGREILAEIGLSTEEMESLAHRGIIRIPPDQ